MRITIHYWVHGLYHINLDTGEENLQVTLGESRPTCDGSGT